MPGIAVYTWGKSGHLGLGVYLETNMYTKHK